MRKNPDCFALRASVVAVQVALLALAAVPLAYAADAAPAVDPLVAELTRPTNMFEVGIGYVTDSSYKFGQYNGLYDKGAFAIVNFDARGGGAYDSDSAMRWRITGTNLGLETRNATAEVGEQGVFRINVGFDELRSNYSDSYQTPYQGSGSNRLTLPANWIKPIVPQVSTSAGNVRALSPTTGLATALTSGVLTPPTAAQQAIVNNIIATDVPDFGNVNLDTTRKTYSGGFSVNFDPRWQLAVSASQMDQTGLKPLSMINIASGTASAVLPNQIDQTTNQYNASLTYTGDQFFMTAAYYGSYFTNHVQSMTFDNFFAPGSSATQSGGAPGNEFNQFLIKGGYNFSPTTKLVMGASYGRNTQNDQYLNNPPDMAVPAPVSSLDGIVVSTAFNAKLTAKPMKNLNLALGYRFNDRDNQTAVNTYTFYDAGEAKTGTSAFNAAMGLPAGTLGSNINIYANRPYSKKVNQVNADAEYFVAPGQAIKGGYEYQQIDRDCPGSWIDCADANRTRQNALRVAWDGNIAEALSGRLSYVYSERKVDYNENAFLALVPMANVIPAGVGATTSVYGYLGRTGLSGFGPWAGFPATPLTGDAAIYSPNNNIVPQALYGSRNNINEEVGLRRYNMADRNQNKLRASVDWGVTEVVSLQGNVEYNDDDYSNSVYGLQSSKGIAATLDANFAISENFTANAFYTYEEQKAASAGISYGSNSNTANVNGSTVVSGGCYATVLERNMNAKIDPCLNWSADMKDRVNTFGAGFAYKGLMSGKLDLLGNLLYSEAKTDNSMTGGTYANNPYAVAGKPAVNPAVLYVPAQNLPTVSTKLFELKLAGQYAFTKASSMRLFYWYQKLDTTDYAYDGLQYGSISSVLPTSQTAPNYNVSVVGLSYIYKWQ